MRKKGKAPRVLKGKRAPTTMPASRRRRTPGAAPREVGGRIRAQLPDAVAEDPIHEANRLVAEAAELLAGAADEQALLSTLAQLAVPQLADWCALLLFPADGAGLKAGLAHTATADAATVREWLLRCLPAEERLGLAEVLRSGESRLVADAVAALRGTIPRGRRSRATDACSAAAESINSFMIVPLALGPQARGAIIFVAAESGRRFGANALAVAENLARHVAVVLDNARLDREGQRLSAELDRRVGERTAALAQAVEQLKQSEAMVQTLFRVSEKLNATLNVESLLDTLAQEAIQMVNGESGFAGLRTADGMLVRKYFLFGEAIAFVHTWHAGEGIPGWVLQHRLPYGTSDAANDPMMRHDLAINRDVRSVICTPILDSTGEVLAYFDIRNKRDAEGFSLNDQEMLMALSPIASIAIQHALAYEQRVQAEIELSYSYERLRALAARMEEVREEERIAIARELHDQLGQALTAMKLDLARLTRHLGEKDATLAREGRAITTQMDTMVKTVRRIATDLRPGVLDNLGLAASIEWQAREFRKRTGIACTVSVPEQSLPLSRAQSTALFRICQETLTNIARHAQARQVHLELTATDEAVMLRVQDDGRGIQHAEVAGTQSLGLLGMRERAKLQGGTFDIRGAPGQGTTVSVNIPLKRTA